MEDLAGGCVDQRGTHLYKYPHEISSLSTQSCLHRHLFMFRKLYRYTQQIIQKLRNMASSNKNLDAEASKFFVNLDEAAGVEDAFQSASLNLPQTARPGTTSPLAKTFAEEEGKSEGKSEVKGGPNPPFTPTPRPEPKSDKSQAEAQPQKVPQGAWTCCMCGVTNPLIGLGCWYCKTHFVCPQCYPA